MDIRFLVLKNEDINRLPDHMLLQLHKISEAIGDIREARGASRDPNYLVVNTDEPWAKDVRKVIDSNV